MDLPVAPTAMIDLLRAWFFAKDRSIITANNTFLQLQHTDNVIFAKFEVDAEHDLTITTTSDGGIRLQPTIDSIDFFQVLDADGGTSILNIDSLNERLGVGTDAPDVLFHVVSDESIIRIEDTNSFAVVQMFNSAATPAPNTPLGKFAFHGQDDAGNQTNYAQVVGYVLDDTHPTENGYLDFIVRQSGSNTTILRGNSSGTIGIGTTAEPSANGSRVLVFGDNTADPTMAANTSGIYGKDVAGTVEQFAIDEAGNAAQLTPHNFSLFTPDSSFEYPYSYYAKNKFIGKEINVDMFGAIRELENSSGKTFIYLQDLPLSEQLDWDTVEDEKKITEDSNRLSSAVNIADDIEVSKTEALEQIEITITTKEIDSVFLDNKFTLIGDEVIHKEIIIYKQKPTGKFEWHLKTGYTFNPDDGKFYRSTIPTDITIIPYSKKTIPKWMANL